MQVAKIRFRIGVGDGVYTCKSLHLAAVGDAHRLLRYDNNPTQFLAAVHDDKANHQHWERNSRDDQVVGSRAIRVDTVGSTARAVQDRTAQGTFYVVNLGEFSVP